ncbi:hypothetical protein HUJ04_001057 [Dendroctonus ponderosae]|nr:hypothetical protein HUJ04_001057 [Dendroctonus ponderosae]
MVRERCEVDHAFSWLSTLGGAFSALGDYFENCAETAGRISMQQLMLAARIGDPNVQARCRLYFSLSLIQKKRFQLASRIIRQEYHLAQRQAAIDERLVRMCKGIWAKLQYEHGTHKRNTISAGATAGSTGLMGAYTAGTGGAAFSSGINFTGKKWVKWAC